MARTDKMFEGGGAPSGIGRTVARAAANTEKLTSEQIKNIKSHAEFIKKNPDRFTKDPDPVKHAQRMKNDSDYRSDLTRAKYIKKTMKEIEGTQKGHSVTKVDPKTGKSTN